MRLLALLALSGLVACGDPEKDDTGSDTTGATGLQPDADEDGDGYTNGEEDAGGTDPYDATDVPYQGGWRKDIECNDSVVAEGNDVGQVAENFEVKDQYGDTLNLYDFCNRVVLIEFSGFT